MARPSDSEFIQYDGNFNFHYVGGWQYDYDAENRLLAVTVNSAPRASFVYDGLGRCVKRTLNGVTRLFNYDGWQPIYEWDGAGQFVAWNLYGVQRGSVCESRQNALDTIGRRGEDRRRPCPGKLASNSKALSIISSTEAIIASRFFAMIRIENGS